MRKSTMKNKFFTFALVLWIISLIALGIISKLVQEDILEQETRRDLEKRQTTTDR